MSRDGLVDNEGRSASLSEESLDAGSSCDTKLARGKYELDYTHVFKSKSCSSTVTRHIKDLVQASVNKSISCGKKRRRKEKRNKLEALPLVQHSKEKASCEETLRKTFVAFSGNAERFICQLPRYIEVRSAVMDLTPYASIDGAHMPGVFTLVPRCKVLSLFRSFGSFRIVFESLKRVIVKEKALTVRGKKNRVNFDDPESNKYATYGAHACRNQPGVKMNMKNINSTGDAYTVLTTLIRKMDHVCKEFIDSESVSSFASIKKLSNVQGMPLCGPDKEGSMWPSMAIGLNAFLSAHTDLDYFLSVVGVICDEELIAHSDIVQYFCFPSKGVSVGLRNGDIIIFNPLIFHCISARCSLGTDVMCITEYIKTAVVSGNDNSRNIEHIFVH